MKIIECRNKHKFTVSNDVRPQFWQCPICGNIAYKVHKPNWIERQKHETKLLNYGIQRRLDNEDF